MIKYKYKKFNSKEIKNYKFKNKLKKKIMKNILIFVEKFNNINNK